MWHNVGKERSNTISALSIFSYRTTVPAYRDPRACFMLKYVYYLCGSALKRQSSLVRLRGQSSVLRCGCAIRAFGVRCVYCFAL